MIRVDRLSVQAGAFFLRDISFEVPTSGFGVLMGPTGCGKTTLLECLCGLKSVQSGRIELAGRDVTRCPPGERGIGYVPQDGALFSTHSVRENLAFSLELRKTPPAEIETRVQELAGLLGIGHLLDRTPAALSGGERQRVALGRALAFRPSILMLDEPLSAVDEEMRGELCALLRKVRETTAVTVLHVTHSRNEAQQLADVLFVLKNGVLQSQTVQSEPTPG